MTSTVPGTEDELDSYLAEAMITDPAFAEALALAWATVGARRERLVRAAFTALCAYEAAAISSRRIPSFTALCRRHRWVEAVLLGFLLLHLHQAINAAPDGA